MSTKATVSTTAPGKYNVASILDGSNYAIWKQEMLSFLQCKGLGKYVTERAEQLKNHYADNIAKLDEMQDNDEKALGYIKCNIMSSYLDVVVTSQTAFDAWKKLETFFAGKETYNKINLLEQLIDGKLVETGNPVNDVQKFVRDKNEIVRRLDSIGMKIAQDLQVAIMLARLPQSFDTMRRIVESQADLDMIKFSAELNREAMRHSKRKRSPEDDESAFMAGDTPASKKQKMMEAKKKLRCTYCGKTGHLVDICFFNPKSSKFRPEFRSSVLKVAEFVAKNQEDSNADQKNDG